MMACCEIRKHCVSGMEDVLQFQCKHTWKVAMLILNKSRKENKQYINIQEICLQMWKSWRFIK